MSPAPHLPQHPPGATHFPGKANPISLPQGTPGRVQGRLCVSAAGVLGPRGSTAVLQGGRGRSDPGSESSAGTLDFSLPGWAAPLPELSCVHSELSCLHRELTITRTSPPWARSRLCTHSSLQHRDGFASPTPWFASLPSKGAASLSVQTPWDSSE